MSVLGQCDSGRGLYFYCPGCATLHRVVPKTAQDQQGWEWNGSMDRPTFSPSVLCLGVIEAGRMVVPRCHSYVRDGSIEYLSDCEHGLAGQTVRLPDKPMERFAGYDGLDAG